MLLRLLRANPLKGSVAQEVGQALGLLVRLALDRFALGRGDPEGELLGGILGLRHLDPPVPASRVVADGLAELRHDGAPLLGMALVGQDVGVLVPEERGRTTVLVPQALGRPDADPVPVSVPAGVGVGFGSERRPFASADASADEDPDAGPELLGRFDLSHTSMLDDCLTEFYNTLYIQTPTYPQSAYGSRTNV